MAQDTIQEATQEAFQAAHKDINQYMLLSAIGNVCMHLAMLTDSVTELTDEIRAGNTHSEEISDSMANLSSEFTTTRSDQGRVANNIDALADVMVSVLNGDDELHVTGAMHVTNDNLDHLERIADNLSTEDGTSIGDSLDSIEGRLDSIEGRLGCITDCIGLDINKRPNMIRVANFNCD